MHDVVILSLCYNCSNNFQFQIGSVFSNDSNTWLGHGIAMFWLSKVYELFDVVLMVLQQQPRRINFNNIFYRGTLPLLAYWSYFIHPRPIVVPVLAINAAVHVFNYMYYFLPSVLPSEVADKMKPGMTKNVLRIEILQFSLMFLYVLYGKVYHGVCIYMVLYTLFMVAYYVRFYYNYINRKKKSHPQ